MKKDRVFLEKIPLFPYDGEVMDWNAEWYENKHGFVAEYGRELLSCVPENPDQSILDLGCGTGTLTHALRK